MKPETFRKFHLSLHRIAGDHRPCRADFSSFNPKELQIYSFMFQADLIQMKFLSFLQP